MNEWMEKQLRKLFSRNRMKEREHENIQGHVPPGIFEIKIV